ncbi:MAG TPA: DUF2171 domain-containing protein [Burkholderiales bacterium]|nr:DUF2171 domain-containing protein [Burkholderiales bacterium]
MMNTNIREHMKVIGSDRQPVGTVDHVEGERIKLAKNDPQAGGEHHYIPADWVERVDGEQVYLRQKAQEVRRQWQTQ